MPCLVCTTKGWHNRGPAWPTTEVAGFTVHLACRYEADLILNFPTDAYLADGAYRWHTNGSVVPDDFLRLAIAFGVADPAYLASHTAALKRQSDEAIALYRSQPHPLDAEALAEARANFEPGTVLVNVITGERTQL